MSHRHFRAAAGGVLSADPRRGRRKRHCRHFCVQAQREEEKDAAQAQISAGAAELYPEGVSEEARAVIDAAKSAIEAGAYADYDEIVNKALAKLEVQKHYEEIIASAEENGIADTARITSASEDALKAIEEASGGAIEAAVEDGILSLDKAEGGAILDGYTAEDSEAIKEIAASAKEEIAKAGSAEEITGIVEGAKLAAQAARFEEEHATDQGVSGVTSGDAGAIQAAIDALEDLGEAVKKVLDDKAAEEGYADYADKLDDLLTKAEFEQQKEQAIAAVSGQVSPSDGDLVRNALESVLEEIGAIEYESHKKAPDAARDEYLSGLTAALEEVRENGADLISLAQRGEELIALIEEDVSDKKETGRYNAALQGELDEIAQSYIGQIDALDPAFTAEEISAALSQLEDIYDEAITALDEVKISGVSAGGLTPDQTPAEEEGAEQPDYGDGHDGSEIWGIVTNDAGMPNGIQLVIEETDANAIAAINEAAQSGKLVVAEGSSIQESGLTAAVSDKEIKTTLDIYLMQGSTRIETFDGHYTVMILLPQSMRSMSGLQVVYVADDGTVEVFETTVQGNYLVFTTTHFSEFYILGDTDLNLWWIIILLACILALEIAAIVVLAARRKKQGKEGGDVAESKKMNALFPAPLLAVNLIPNGAIAAIITLAALVAVAAGAIGALLIKGRKRETAAAGGKLPATQPVQPETPAPIAAETAVTASGSANAAGGAAAAGAAVLAGAAAAGGVLPLIIGDWYTRIRYDRSFEARLIQSDGQTKRYYSELKNELMSYRKVTARMSWKHEAFRRGRPAVAKFVFRGKTLCLCLALDPKAYADSKYIVDDMSEIARFEGTPLLYRIKNERRLRYAKELIAVLLAGAERVNAEPTDYSAIPYEETEPLVERGLIRIAGTERVRYDGKSTAAYEDEEDLEPNEETEARRESVSVAQAAAMMSDDAAEHRIEEGVRYADKTKTAIVNVDTLSNVFSDGEKVTLEEIKARVPSVNKKVTYIKILARGELNKALVVEADDFSLEAVKMIALCGGRIIRTRRRDTRKR